MGVGASSKGSAEDATFGAATAMAPWRSMARAKNKDGKAPVVVIGAPAAGAKAERTS
jgi:hypothetical protein